MVIDQIERHPSVTAERGEARGSRKRQARRSGQTRDQDGRNTMQQPGPYYETRYEIAAVIAKRILSMEPLLLALFSSVTDQLTVRCRKRFKNRRNCYSRVSLNIVTLINCSVLPEYYRCLPKVYDTHKYVFTLKTKFPTTVTFCVGTVYAYNGDFSADFVERAAGIWYL